MLDLFHSTRGGKSPCSDLRFLDLEFNISTKRNDDDWVMLHAHHHQWVNTWPQPHYLQKAGR